ncbi:MAG: hypothetical protein HQL32_06625 [Planctomycetes bacterium]|nr:hypothetical protein [Planctomycetota bacterium]
MTKSLFPRRPSLSLKRTFLFFIGLYLFSLHLFAATVIVYESDYQEEALAMSHFHQKISIADVNVLSQEELIAWWSEGSDDASLALKNYLEGKLGALETEDGFSYFRAGLAHQVQTAPKVEADIYDNIEDFPYEIKATLAMTATSAKVDFTTHTVFLIGSDLAGSFKLVTSTSFSEISFFYPSSVQLPAETPYTTLSDYQTSDSFRGKTPWALFSSPRFATESGGAGTISILDDSSNSLINYDTNNPSVMSITDTDTAVVNFVSSNIILTPGEDWNAPEAAEISLTSLLLLEDGLNDAHKIFRLDIPSYQGAYEYFASDVAIAQDVTLSITAGTNKIETDFTLLAPIRFDDTLTTSTNAVVGGNTVTAYIAGGLSGSVDFTVDDSTKVTLAESNSSATLTAISVDATSTPLNPDSVMLTATSFGSSDTIPVNLHAEPQIEYSTDGGSTYTTITDDNHYFLITDQVQVRRSGGVLNAKWGVTSSDWTGETLITIPSTSQTMSTNESVTTTYATDGAKALVISDRSLSTPGSLTLSLSAGTQSAVTKILYFYPFLINPQSLYMDPYTPDYETLSLQTTSSVSTHNFSWTFTPSTIGEGFSKVTTGNTYDTTISSTAAESIYFFKSTSLSITTGTISVIDSDDSSSVTATIPVQTSSITGFENDLAVSPTSINIAIAKSKQINVEGDSDYSVSLSNTALGSISESLNSGLRSTLNVKQEDDLTSSFFFHANTTSDNLVIYVNNSTTSDIIPIPVSIQSIEIRPGQTRSPEISGGCLIKMDKKIILPDTKKGHMQQGRGARKPNQPRKKAIKTKKH